MSSDSSYSPEVSSLEHSEETNEVKVVLTADIATAIIKETKDAIEAGEVSEDLLTRLIQYYLAITGSNTDTVGYSIVEDSAYILFALHAIQFLPTILSSTGPFATNHSNVSKINTTTVRINHMRTVYSSTVRLLTRYESASAQEQYILPYLLILITRLLPTAMELCEPQDRETFLQVLYQNAEIALSSTVCLLDIVHAVYNGYSFTGPLEDLYAALNAEEEAGSPCDSDSEDQTQPMSVTSSASKPKPEQRDSKKRKYPLLSLSITQLLTELVTITAGYEEECQRLIRSLWSKYLSQHGRPRLTQIKALGIQRQLIVHVYTKAPRKVLTEMLLGFSKQIISHIRCCFVGKGQLLFTRSSTKSGKGKKRTIFDDPTRKKGGKNLVKEDAIQRYRDLCSWVFVASVELSLMVIKACNLTNLIHPYIEICFYYNEVVPSSLRFFPCRVKILTAMTRLAEGPDSKKPLYIPLLHSIMEMIIEAVKPASSSSNASGDTTSYADSIGKWRSRILAENAEGTLSGSLLSLNALLLCPKELASTLIYRKTVFYESLNLFCANVIPYLYHPSFPELMYKPTHYLKHLVLSMKEKESLLGHDYKIHYTSVIRPTYMEICMILDGLRRAINRHIALVVAVRLDLRLHTKNLIDGDILAAMKAIKKRIIDDGFTVQDIDEEGSNENENNTYNRDANQHKVIPTLAQLLEKYTAIKGERTVLQKEELGGSKRYKVLDPSDESDNNYESDEEYSSGDSNGDSHKDAPTDFNAMEKEDSELSSGSSSGIDLAENFNEDIIDDLVLPNS
ncbi:Hypothetical protein GLP15_1511 [Giardia lamblia P15]|uniref:Noc2p family protein n=1 Tax=Giardia intestinalis (strain P15) TaxID=658858 RepID=E1EYN0_GIAIA|nr:Hypothetical protein GLP15_1511 [Giardia lamblia P15]